MSATPERVALLAEARHRAMEYGMGQSKIAADLIARLVIALDEDESRLRQIEAERDKWHNLVKSLCDEWNDECPPGCDSYAHEDDCGATSITVAMRKRGEEIAALRAEVAALAYQALDALTWCSGSADFAPKGQARLGWERGPVMVMAAARAVLDRLFKEAK